MERRDHARGGSSPVEPEYAVEKDFVRAIESLGWKTLKADRLRRGWSDTFCFGPGALTVIAEFKRSDAPRGDRRRGEKLQAYYRTEFENLGFKVYKLYGRADAEWLFFSLTAQRMSEVLESIKVRGRGAGDVTDSEVRQMRRNIRSKGGGRQ